MWRLKSPGVPNVELDLVREELSGNLNRGLRVNKIQMGKLVAMAMSCHEMCF